MLFETKKLQERESYNSFYTNLSWLNNDEGKQQYKPFLRIRLSHSQIWKAIEAFDVGSGLIRMELGNLTQGSKA